MLIFFNNYYNHRGRQNLKEYIPGLALPQHTSFSSDYDDYENKEQEAKTKGDIIKIF